jgi:hypothetical protein
MIWPSGLTRHEHEDHVVEDLPDDGRVVGREPMHQLDGHLRRTDLGRMDVAGDQHDGLARAEDLLALAVARRAALEVQLAFELLEALDVLQRVRRADFDRDERVAVGRLAQFVHAHAVGCRGDHLHVLHDLVPARELRVGSDLEAEELLGRLKGRGRPLVPGYAVAATGAPSGGYRGGRKRREQHAGDDNRE